jgi:hypothetical protein
MSTQTKILANRLNAQKSTGPNTPQGKAVVSQNALKHGLSARHDVITTESQADFDLHRDALLAELDPIGPMESILADRIVSLSWRLKRADLIQNQTFDAMHEKNTNNSLANIAKSFGLKGLGFPQDETSDSRPDLTLGRIALKDFSNARVLDRLLMYERRIEHSLYKTTLELQKLHLLRNLDPSEPNLEPEDRRLAVVGTTTHSPQIQPPEPGQNHPTSTIQHPVSRSEAETPWGEYQESGIIAQNKPNVKMGNINISTATVKAYAEEQRTMNNEHYPKQTQSNPIPPSPGSALAIRRHLTSIRLSTGLEPPGWQTCSAQKKGPTPQV